MSLADHWEPGATSILAIVTGAALLAFAARLWSYFLPSDGLAVGVVLNVTVLGLVLIALGAVDDLDLRPYGKLLAAIVASVIVGAAVVFYLRGIETAAPGPDAILFAQYSVRSLLRGINPYAVSMAPSWELYGASTLSVTPRIDGSYVTSLSYPAGSVLVFLPQRALGWISARKTVGLLALASLVFLIGVAPREYALAPIPVFISTRIIHQSFLGVIDAIWLFPTLVAMYCWYRDRWGFAAVALGCACAMKQQPWLITPFLAIWVYYNAESYREFAIDGGRLAGYGLGTFTLINLPFIVWNPQAWLEGVLTPLNAGASPMVIQGMGISLLSVSGTIGLTKGFYTVLFASAFVWALVFYAVYFERLRWVAWFAPALLLFLNYRSLLSYFTFFAPVGLLAGLCAHRLALRSFGMPQIREVREYVVAD